MCWQHYLYAGPWPIPPKKIGATMNCRDTTFTVNDWPKPGKDFNLEQDDRPIWASCQLSSRIGHGSLRFPVPLLHVRRYDVPSKAGRTVLGGIGPIVLGFCSQRRTQAQNYRWRAPCPTKYYEPVPQFGAASENRRTR